MQGADVGTGIGKRRRIGEREERQARQGDEPGDGEHAQPPLGRGRAQPRAAASSAHGFVPTASPSSTDAARDRSASPARTAAVASVIASTSSGCPTVDGIDRRRPGEHEQGGDDQREPVVPRASPAPR